MKNKSPAFPVEGMKVVPEYYGTEAWEILQGGFWTALCGYLIEQPEARAAFKEATGLSVESITSKNAIEAMIDDATGYKNHVMSAWCDWVTLTHWGVKDGVIL